MVISKYFFAILMISTGCFIKCSAGTGQRGYNCKRVVQCSSRLH